MGVKFVLFLLVATAGRSSVAQNSSNSCIPVTDIAADLGIIQFANDVTYRALLREAEITFNLIKTLLAERAGNIRVDSEYAESRFALIKTEALIAGSTLVTPLVEAIQTFQHEIDVENQIRQATALITSIVTECLNGIEFSQRKKYSEALAAIEGAENRAFAGGDALLQGIFNSLINGPVEVPLEAETAIACAHAKAASAFRDGLSGIFDGARILLRANFWQTEAEINSFASQIEDAYNRTTEGFTVEVTTKIGSIRNLVISAFLKKIGIVQGLFAIQATPFGIYV